jgi:hypothetical protein
MPSQSKSLSYIQSLIKHHNIAVEPGIVLVADSEPWRVFEYEKRCLGVDTDGGLWIGDYGQKWRSLGECTVSDALMAVQFLVSGEQL